MIKITRTETLIFEDEKDIERFFKDCYEVEEDKSLTDEEIKTFFIENDTSDILGFLADISYEDNDDSYYTRFKSSIKVKIEKN